LLSTSTISSDPLALAHRLRPVLLQLARQLRREVHPLGVTGGQVAVLASVRRAPGSGVRELAAREGVSPAAMSRLIGRLERSGLIDRLPGPGGDRRRIGLEITPAGERVLRLVRSRRTAWLTAQLGRLDADELARVEAALPALSALLEGDE
jgi:DNA-binding MarR family transcriptional regulator